MTEERVKVKMSMTFTMKGNLDDSETFLANLKALTNPSKFTAEAHIVPAWEDREEPATKPQKESAEK